jgi:hypothetical protein
MGYSTYPPAASGVIKSIQRGTATVAGTVTITAVDMAKSTVTSFSNGSSGIVALSGTGTINFSEMGSGGTITGYGQNSGGSISANVVASGGTNTLVSATFGAYLATTTTIIVDGPCIWQVVEYN